MTRYLLMCIIVINFVLQILKKDIHIPETMGVEVVGYSYPPRLLIAAQSNLDFTSPKICVEGTGQEMWIQSLYTSFL